jgi:hypothetical protein
MSIIIHCCLPFTPQNLFLIHFLAVFPDVVEISSKLASDVAGVAGHTAPKSADAGIPAPDLAPANCW